MKLMNYTLQGTYKENVQNDVTNQQISMDTMKNLNNGSVKIENHFAENSSEHLENPKSVPGAKYPLQCFKGVNLIYSRCFITQKLWCVAFYVFGQCFLNKFILLPLLFTYNY